MSYLYALTLADLCSYSNQVHWSVLIMFNPLLAIIKYASLWYWPGLIKCHFYFLFVIFTLIWVFLSPFLVYLLEIMLFFAWCLLAISDTCRGLCLSCLSFDNGTLKCSIKPSPMLLHHSSFLLSEESIISSCKISSFFSTLSLWFLC